MVLHHGILAGVVRYRVVTIYLVRQRTGCAVVRTDDLVGASVFLRAAFRTGRLHEAYAYGDLSACDCHGLVWHDADLVQRGDTGPLECPIPDDWAVDTSRRVRHGQGA
jgi:hypothetical protein